MLVTDAYILLSSAVQAFDTLSLIHDLSSRIDLKSKVSPEEIVGRQGDVLYVT